MSVGMFVRYTLYSSSISTFRQQQQQQQKSN